MKRTIPSLLLMCLWLQSSILCPAVFAQTMRSSSLGLRVSDYGDGAKSLRATNDLIVAINKSIVVDYGSSIRRISVASADVADAVAVSSSEVLLNGKATGDTSLIIWDQQGKRSTFDIHVVASTSKLDAVREQLTREVGPDVVIEIQDGTVFLRGTVKDEIAADRAYNIASTLGKVVNLLRVLVPPTAPQILLKVRFADVDRSASMQLGVNLFSVDSTKGIASSTTGQFGTPPTLNTASAPATFSLTNLMNIFYYRSDINLGAVLQDLETKNLLQILAEPNLLTVSGQAASFLAGGEFPFPTLQGGGAGVGQITIQFKEFGIRINFQPMITPRGTIRMTVVPEVSSLDYANGLTVSGYTIPGLSTRRVQTEVELESGQSFVIAGLLDNQLTETLNRLPGFANIPILGKLFQSKSINKSNTELLVLVTPEIVRPIPAGSRMPDLNMPMSFMKNTMPGMPENPGAKVTGAISDLPKRETMPIEELRGSMQAKSSTNGSGTNLSPSPANGANFAPAIQPVMQGTPAPATPVAPASAPNN